ncbi:tape measure protein [Sphingobacterium sp. BIGb0116]|uniref:tape measure protein n=1 Tax=Sphingobacterium sp. BIGb0116 TaxID=2940619 RepID=UPI002167E2B9|nr:tape measure protein [Sphingobacterium sp. BIGb0116]MCS4164468.1 hypothetical protein [Sphingobacterium sp. BIGb0116]
MSTINRLEWDAYIRDSELMAALNRIEQRVNRMANNVNNRGRDLEEMFSRLAKVAGGFLSLNAAENFIQKLIQVRSEFQQLEIAFTTMLGSKERADKLTQDLIEFAGTTPFGMKDTANAAKQLLAYGSTAENVKNELRMLGDVAAGTSQPIGDLVYLYGTLRTQGRAYLMDIRQFAGRGIPIYEELAKVLKINKSEVNDFVSAGKVGFAEVQQAFQNMTAAGSMFGGLMEAQSRTIQGELERLGDAFDQMLNKMGKDSEGVISGAIQAASVLVENYETVLNLLTGLISVYGAYQAALIATAALQQLVAARAVGMTVAEMLHYGAIVLKTKAMAALNAVMAANPVILMTAAIITLSSAIYALSQVTDATSAAQEKLANAHAAGVDRADQEKRSVQQLIGVIKDNTASVEERKAAYDKLQAQTKGVLASFSQEEIAIGKATKALDNYIVSIGRAASARKAFDEFNALAEQLDVINRKGIDGVGVWERTGRALQNAFGVNGGDAAKSFWGFGDKRGDAFIVDQQKDVIKKQMNALQKEFDKEFKTFITGVDNTVKENGVVDVFANSLKDPLNNFNSLLKSATNKADLDKIKKALTEKMEALAPGNSDIAKYKAKLEQLAKVEKQYSIGGNEKAANQEYQEAERYLSILSDISKARQGYLNSQLTRDQQEIQSVKDKYKTLIDEIDKFNRNPKNTTKITTKQIQSITNVRDQEVNDTIYKLQTDKKLVAYQIDFDNYVKYENLKNEYGIAVAEKQLGQYKNSFEKISGEYAGLLTKQKTVGLNAGEKDRLDKLFNIIKANGKRLAEYDTSRYTDALKAAQTLNDKLFEIDKEHAQKTKELRDKNELTPDREKILNKERDIKASKAAVDELTGTLEWEKLFSGMDQMGSKQIESLLKVIETRFEELKGKFDPIDLENLKKQLREAQGILIEKNPFSQFAVAIKEIMANAGDDSEEAAEKTKTAWVNLTKATKNSFEFISDAVNSASVLKDAIGEVGATALASLTALSVAAVAVSSAVKQAERASVILAIIQAALIVVQSLFSIIDGGSKKRNEQLKKEQEYYNTLSETFDILIGKQKELFEQKSGKDSLDAYKEALELVNSKLIANRKSLEAWFSQGASLFKHSNWYNYDKELGDVLSRQQLLNMNTQEWENLLLKQPELWAKLPEEVRKYGQSVIDAKGETEELKTALQEALSGISLDDIKGEFESLFTEADLTFGDISDSFYKHMQKAVLRLVQDGKMTQSIQDWYDKVMDSMQDGDLTKTESDALKAEYKAIAEAGNKRYQDLMKLIGYDGELSSSGLKSSVQRDLTEGTASELTGLFRSEFEIEKKSFDESKSQGINIARQLQIANSSLTALNAIQFNTGETVKRLDSAVSELQSLNKNLGARY